LQLKSIVINGFKSFPDKKVFKIDDGITGVVGPNGSGKSNVSDAVRWVLGEQSPKSLRGSKMIDVIFGGTDTRRQKSFCEVSMVFDNHLNKLDTDFDEVQISRKLYRSGESEYQINKAHSRLKDIQDLFRDTGIGKEGYSIIGQGKIDEILTEKGTERRKIMKKNYKMKWRDEVLPQQGNYRARQLVSAKKCEKCGTWSGLRSGNESGKIPSSDSGIDRTSMPCSSLPRSSNNHNSSSPGAIRSG